MRIVYRVCANNRIGLGHVYRGMTLAKEMKQHTFVFLATRDDAPFVQKVLGDEYELWVANSEFEYLAVYQGTNVVINDVLDTTASSVMEMKNRGITVINLEDLGTGAVCADLTINALYQEPQFEGGNVLWGVDYYSLRDEFIGVRQHGYGTGTIDTVMVTYGGTDPTDLTRKTLEVIAPYCKQRSMRIYIVIGPGYQHEGELLDYLLTLDQRLFLVKQTGFIAKIMEQSQVAFCSNGRTIYELLHMRVPTIVTAHSERENTHDFACKENGFINLGVYQKGVGVGMRAALQSLENWMEYRSLISNMQKHDLTGNTERVAEEIGRVIE